MTPTSSFLLQLVRFGIHPDAELAPTPPDVDWGVVAELASAQKVTAIAWDGYARLYEAGMVTADMDRNLKKQWLATVYQNYEQRYPVYLATIDHLASILAKHGIRMMVLKGYGLSLNYPIPMHRPCGDVDFWTFGEAERADRVLEEELGIRLNGSPEHHTTFYFEDQYFEHHHTFVGAKVYNSSKVVEARLNELATIGLETVDIDGQKVSLPSPDFNALFLLRHAATHFAGSKINLRQILDWGMFVQKYHEQIDWNSLESYVESVEMIAFYRVLNGICVDYLGFPPVAFPAGRHPLEVQVLEDSLQCNTEEQMPRRLFPRLFFKYHRWKKRAWKRRLGYSGGWSISLWSTVRAHVLNPKSI